MLATFTPAIPGTLPDDLWVEIYHYLEIVYIVRSARVCRYLNELIKLRPIWVNAISSQIHGQGLELPDRDLDIPLADYDAAVLRDMTIRAIKLTLNLASESPQPTGAKDVQLRGKPNVTHIFLVHGSQSTEWLLFFTDAKSIFCWELLKDPLDLLPASSWDSGEAWILEAVHDTTQSTRCILAVTVKENRTEIYRTLILNVADLQAGAIPRFHVLHTIENNAGRPYLIRGDHVVMWKSRRKVATIFNWKTGGREEYRLLPDGHPNAGIDTVEHCCAVGLTATSLVMVTTSFRAAWDVVEHSSSQFSTLILPEQLTLPSETRLASMVQLSLASPLLDYFPHKDTTVAVFLAFSRIKYVTGTESARYELIIRRHDIGREWMTFPLGREGVLDEHLSPYVQGVMLSNAGRGIIMDTEPREQVPLQSTPRPRLLAFDILHRNPVLGITPAISPVCFRTGLIKSTETTLGHLVLKNESLRTTCFSYDDAQGRIVVATSDGRLRVIEYM